MASFFDMCPNSFVSVECFFNMVHFFPVYLTVVIWTGSFITGSIYLFFLGFGVTLDQLINAAFRYLINQDGLHGIHYQMPARAPQLAVYFVSMIILLVLTFRLRFSTYRITFIAFFEILAVYAPIYLEINTTKQGLAGVMCGLVDAIIQFAVFYYFIYLNLPKIKEACLYKWCGLSDTFLHAIDDHDYIYRAKVQDLVLYGGFENIIQLKLFVENIPIDGTTYSNY